MQKTISKNLNEFLDPIRQKRKELEKKPKLIKEILGEGKTKTQKKVKETLEITKEAMGIKYKF